MAKTILVVDDSPVLRASVRFALTKNGFQVAEAGNGAEGLRVLDELAASGQRPAMIFSDINMPIMDGITFITEVKKRPRERFIPILVLTTESQTSKKMEGKKAGAAGWLVKPFQESQLLAVLKRFVR